MRIVNTDLKCHNDSISRFDSLVLNDTVFIHLPIFMSFGTKPSETLN